MVSALTGLSSPADGDELYIVDVSDTTDGASGSSRKVTRSNLFSGATFSSASLTSPTITTGVVVTSFDMNGAELILDADADTSITADTDDQIDIRISGADDFVLTANKFEVQSGSVIDMNGQKLDLDADADTSITADTDDQIDIEISGADDFRFSANEFTVLSGSKVTSNGAVDITIADDGNDVGLTVTQNDVTNNPIAATVTNAGTGNGLFIDQNGNGIALNIDSEATTVQHLAVSSGVARTGGNLLFLNDDHASTSAVTATIKQDGTGIAAQIQKIGAGTGLFINQDGNGISINIDTEVANDGTIFQITPAGTSPSAFLIGRNDDVTGNVVLRLGGSYIWVDATGDLRIKTSAPTSDTDGNVVGGQS